MRVNRLVLLVGAAVGLAVRLGGCNHVSEPQGHRNLFATPEEVVEGFYGWHLDYPGDPLADRTYASNEHLTDEMIAEVDGMVDSFGEASQDPFLCIRNTADTFTMGKAEVSGEGDFCSFTVN